MQKQLEEILKKYTELTDTLNDPQTARNPQRLQELSKEHARLSETAEKYTHYKNLKKQLDDTKVLLKNEESSELIELATVEIKELEEKTAKLELELKKLLIPKNPLDSKNTFLEIRAGTGGNEAALFVADLFRMYSKFAEHEGWRVEVMSSNAIGLGGLKEIIALVSGKDVYAKLKHEAGVHRVQRVPITEAQGRIHTSAVTVAVLPEAEDVEVKIDEKDLRIDVYRSSGPGGQSVNTTDSAVRITHIPTGLVVAMQDEKSQHKNKAKAMKVLRARLFELEEQKRREAESAARKSMVGTGDRSERIRTYNFPQNRVTDHRINLTLHKLDYVIEGELDEIIIALREHFQSKALLSE